MGVSIQGKNARFPWTVGPSLLFWGEGICPTIGFKFKLIWALGLAGGQGRQLLSGAIYKKGLGNATRGSQRGPQAVPFLRAWDGRRTRVGCGATYRWGP